MTVTNDVFNGLGVELETLEREDFLKLRETLTRIGLLQGKNQLQQTCYILHKRGKYALMHHLEMRKMDGGNVTITEEDIRHRNSVACLIDKWGLGSVKDESLLESDPSDDVTVITHKDKHRFELAPLYEIGKVSR